MTRLLARAVGCAIFGGLAGAAAMILLSGLDPHFTLEMTQDRPGLLRGFYPGERDGDLTFAWTAARAELPLAGLDRNVAWRTRIRVRGGRLDPATLPSVTVLADDVPLATRRTTNTFEDLEATIPAKAGHVRGVTLSLAVSNTFVPGPTDGRALGVQIDRIAITPAALGAFPPRRTVAAAALGSAVFGAIFGLLAATATTAVGAATLLAVAQAAVLRIGLGPFAPWLTLVELLAASIGIALLVIALGIERWRQDRLRHTARFALMFTGAVLYLHLLVLLHPDKPVAGVFLVDTLAQYSTAVPIAHVDHVTLLWIGAAVAEAISFLFFYWTIVRGTGDRLMAAVAVAVLQLMPVGFDVLAQAGLADIVGRAFSIVTIAMVTGALLDRRPWQFLAAWGAALLAFLSDPGTFVALSLTLGLAAILLAALGSPGARRLGLGMGLTLIVSVSAAVRFVGGAFVTHAMARTGTSFGWPFLALAVVGLFVTVRSPRDDWSLLLWAWLTVSIVGVVGQLFGETDLRTSYVAMPPVAVLAARGTMTLWNSGSRQRALAVAAAGLGAALGVIGWLGALAPSLE